MGTNGTYICDKHNNILAWATEIKRHALALQAGVAGHDAIEAILDLANDITVEAHHAKRDGQRMEDKLVARAVQGDVLADLAHGLQRLGNTITQHLTPAKNEL